MKCKECQKAEATTTLNDVDLCDACADKLEPKLKQLGRMFDQMREEQHTNMRMYGNHEGTIDRDEYLGRKGRGL